MNDSDSAGAGQPDARIVSSAIQVPAPPMLRAMEDSVLRLLIRNKLDDGRLRRQAIPRVWGGPGHGETCTACEDTVEKSQLVIEGSGDGGEPTFFHVQCFQVWDSERRV